MNIYYALYEDILHFLKSDVYSPEKIKEIIEQNGRFLLGTPGYSLFHNYHMKFFKVQNSDILVEKHVCNFSSHIM